jgi:hypothetical protein
MIVSAICNVWRKINCAAATPPQPMRVVVNDVLLEAAEEEFERFHQVLMMLTREFAEDLQLPGVSICTFVLVKQAN